VIPSRDLLETARVLSLEPRIVEKDYVLGWLLAAIYAQPELAETWVFKGGTCLKKCYFETYRFSEDLDFTITDPGQIDEPHLREVFTGVCEWTYDRSGIEAFPDRLRFEVYADRRGSLSCEGRFYYRGPVSPRGDPPMIKLDLSSDELLALEPVVREVNHPYADRPVEGIHARCYAFEEIFAEKVRALGERCRPRDLYDVIHLYRRDDKDRAASQVHAVLESKCQFKGIAAPTLDALAPYREELATEWSNMLAHQLQFLPPMEEFWNQLSEVFRWLEGSTDRPALRSLSGQAGETLLPREEASLQAAQLNIGRSALESVFFAAANHLCIDLRYDNRTRRIEPYSLRRTREGHLLLYGCNAQTGEIRSYRVDRIQDASVTGQAFSPRFAVELTDRGPSSAPPAARRPPIQALPPTLSPGKRPRARRQQSRRARGSTGTGPRYVYQCPMCGRRFTHTTRSASLRPHKNRQGSRCSGRRGTFVGIK
jgi:predicted nucleotidyltransferase component of viral defense system